MKRIPLTKGKEALVDDVDYEFLIQWEWYAVNGRYAARKMSISEPTPSHAVLMHRVVAERAGYRIIEDVDHRDRNGLNNCRYNLRPASRSNNLANRGPQRNNTSRFKGVSYTRDRDKWRACIKVSGRTIHIGYFDSKREAAEAYNLAAVKHFGEFAYLNPV